MVLVLLLVFFVGYLAITFEGVLKINKMESYTAVAQNNKAVQCPSNLTKILNKIFARLCNESSAKNEC